MGLWGKIKKKIKKAAKKVAKAVKTAVNAVEEAVTDVIETVGNAIEDAADAASDFLEEHLGVVGKALGTALKWVGSLVSGVLDLVGAVVKGVFGIISGAVSGVVLIVGGILSLDGGLILEGFLDIVSGVAGAAILIVGKAIAVLQSVFHLQPFERRLTEDEIKLLKRVFHESVALYNVQIIEGWSGFFSINDHSFVLGNTIYMKNHSTKKNPEKLVHECTHVWQYQNKGASYASDAIGAQLFEEDAYDWEHEIADGREDWVDFNLEAQAEFLEDIYLVGELRVPGVSPDPRGDGVFYDADGETRVGYFEFGGVDHTDRANDAVAEVRGELCVRLSGLWS